MADPKRPPWTTCKVCGRKAVAPEKIDKGGERWRIPPIMKCNNCIALQSRTFDDLNVKRKKLIKSKDEMVAIFPLMLLDIRKDQLIGTYKDFRTLRRKMNEYLDDNPKSKDSIKIIDRKYHDFTDHVIYPS